jgi:ribA/ribD-fused uncharacterized protein
MPGELPLDVYALRHAVEAGAKLRYRHFWGHTPRADGQLSEALFSQWWRCTFEVDGQAYTTAEQLMMAGKARCFGDDEALAQILATDDPAEVKRLGRTVRGFDEKVWAAQRFELVTRGNVAKFGQEPSYRAYLLATGDDVLVEASPHDKIWGIGLGVEDARAADPRKWQGKNLLGFALMKARATLRDAP